MERQAFDKMLEEYYQLRGWDIATGLPKAETMKRLGLEDIAEDLKGERIIEVGLRERMI